MLTCLEEVSLGEARRIVAFVWGEEETNSTNLNHKDTHMFQHPFLYQHLVHLQHLQSLL